jgi:hypothetical protein
MSGGGGKKKIWDGVFSKKWSRFFKLYEVPIPNGNCL